MRVTEVDKQKWQQVRERGKKREKERKEGREEEEKRREKKIRPDFNKMRNF